MDILKKIKLAILYKKVMINEQVIILFPARPIIGETSKKDMYILDYINSSIYENLQMTLLDNENKIYSFYDSTSLYDLIKKYNTKDIKEILQKEFNELSQNIKLIDITNDVSTFEILTRDEFNEKYGFDLDITYKPLSLKNFSSGIFDESMIKMNDFDIEICEDKEVKTQKNIEFCNIGKAYSEIKENVIAQDDAIRKVLTAIYKNNKIDNPRMKTNILLYGNSGVGKTEILRQIQKVTNLPIVIEDMNTYTISGYKGNNVEELLRKLYIEADYNIDLAQKGILCLDEIDKKVSAGDESSIAHEGVLNSLLKIIEGGKFEFSINDIEKIEFDTSYLTVIASGAFSQLKSRVNENTKHIGFENNIQNKEKSNFTTEDFIKYGLPREFMGRFSSIIKLNDLSKDDLKNILLNSKISSLKTNIEMLKKLNIEVSMSDSLIDEIVERAYKENIGARALNKIINNIFEEATFEAFVMQTEDKKILKLDKHSIEDNKQYKFVKKL